MHISHLKKTHEKWKNSTKNSMNNNKVDLITIVLIDSSDMVVASGRSKL